MFQWLARQLKPDRIYPDILQIDFPQYWDQGIRLVLLDIDNTLVHHGARAADDFAREAVRRIQNAGMTAWIVSNAKPKRAAAFAGTLDLSFTGLAGKPSPRGLLRACQSAGVRPDQAMMIGDQLFTDILAARRARTLAILVRPRHDAEAWNVRFKRQFELPFLRLYGHQAEPDDKGPGQP